MSDDPDDDLSLDDSFDDFEKTQRTLGDLMRDNPLFKIGAVVGAGIIIFALISFFGGDEGPVKESYVGEAPDITATPGAEDASPAYVQAIEELNEADIERALTEGDSSLPVPVEPPLGIIGLSEDKEEADEDPLQRWRRIQEERLAREERARAAIPVMDTDEDDIARQEAIQALADAMSQQMSSILGRQPAAGTVNSRQMTSPDFLALLTENQAGDEQEQTALAQEDVQSAGETAQEVLLPAAEIVYAQLLMEANTDVPGPVLAEIMSGPLKGSRLLGGFQEQNKLLTLNFNKVVYEEEALSVSAVAIDPATTLPGMATEVDNRYFKRIILPAAAAFVRGMASAVAQSGRTNITVRGETVAEENKKANKDQQVATGVREAGQEVEEILNEITTQTKTMVRIAAGTPIGVLFVEPVKKGGETQAAEDAEGL